MSHNGTATEALRPVDQTGEHQRHLHLVEQVASLTVSDYFNELSGAPGVDKIDTGEVDDNGTPVTIDRHYGQIPFGD